MSILQPTAGFFLDDRLAVGGAIPINYTSSSSIQSFEIALLPLFRYYLSGSDRRYHWFAEANGGWLRRRSEFTGGNDQFEVLNNTFRLGAGMGLNYFLRPSVALEGSLGYTYTQESFDNDFQVFDDNHSVINFNIGIQVFLSASGV